MKFSSFAFVGLLILKINLVGGYQAFVLSVGETNLSDGFSKSFPNLSDNIKHILISTGKWDLEKFKAVPIIIDNMFWKISENKLSQGSIFHCHRILEDSTAGSIFVVILVELTNTVFFNSTNITTNIETAALSSLTQFWDSCGIT